MKRWPAPAPARPPSPCRQIKPNPKNARETAVAVAHEGERVLKCIAAGDRVVLLDERGRDASSEDIARLLGQVRVLRMGMHIGGCIGVCAVPCRRPHPP